MILDNRYNRLKNVVKRILNYFFRGNNLLWVQIKSKIFCDNIIRVGASTNLSNVKISMAGGGNLVQIGEHCSLSGVAIFMNGSNNRLIIGNNVRVNNATKTSLTCFNACDGCTIEIDDNCLFSNRIEIHTTDYHKIFINNNSKRNNIPANVHIGKHSWVGLRSIILKGVHLPSNTIVGANSVVVSSYNESNVIIAGSPAKIVKRNVEWDY